MTILMTPDMSNFSGNVHGGTLMKYLDQVTYTCATCARNYAVTLSVDHVVFREPIHVVGLVSFQASVSRTGRRSMEIGVRVATQDLAHRFLGTPTAATSRWSQLDRMDAPWMSHTGSPVPPRSTGDTRRQHAVENCAKRSSA
jgi:acyl-CoA hydrolase